MKLLGLLSAAIFAAAARGENPVGIPADYQLLYAQDFAKPDALADFVFSDPAAWKITEADGKPALELVKQSAYKPAVRSPVNLALLKDRVFGDVIFEADCLQTGKEYGHRDMVFISGFQSPTKFLYTHIASAADDHAHNCFIVNDAPRVKFARETTKGADWGLGIWHHVRIERRSSDGIVRVFFDDMKNPIMQGGEKTFGPGFIGFGSFDDTGKIANVKVWGKAVETKATPRFSGAP